MGANPYDPIHAPTAEPEGAGSRQLGGKAWEVTALGGGSRSIVSQG